MKPHRKPAASAGLVLRYPCPLAELEDILRAVDLSQVRDHVHRLQQQLALAEKVLASLAEEQRARQEAGLRRLRATFAAMSSPELERYIAAGKPNCRLAKRILTERIESERRRAKAAQLAATATAGLPCEPGADSDYWRIHGG